MKKIFKFRLNFILFFLSLLISLTLCEILLRRLKLGYNASPLNPSKTSHHENPPNFEFTTYSPYGEWNSFNIKFDEFGNRKLDDLCNWNKFEEKYQLILMGDSFVEGVQVSDSDSLAGILQKELCQYGVKVHNFGTSSYGPVLSYAHLLQQNKVNPKINLSSSTVLINFLFENDIEDDNKYYEYSKNNYLEEDSKFTVNATTKLSFLQRINRRSYLARLIRRSHLTLLKLLDKNRNEGINKLKIKYFSPIDRCRFRDSELHVSNEFVGRIKEFANSKGSIYFLTAIPHHSKNARFTNYGCFKNIAKKQNLQFIEAPNKLFTDPSSYYFDRDLHLNIQGNKLLAVKIKDFLINNTNFLNKKLEE